VTDLPLDIHGKPCELRRYYWVESAGRSLVGQFFRDRQGTLCFGCYDFASETLVVSCQLTDRYAPAEPYVFPPREKP
jgi:hypothetical protein